MVQCYGLVCNPKVTRCFSYDQKFLFEFSGRTLPVANEILFSRISVSSKQDNVARHSEHSRDF